MEGKRPPVLADRFLSWFCKGELLEEIQGDLHEFYERLSAERRWKNQWIYWFHVFHFLRPFALRKIKKVKT